MSKFIICLFIPVLNPRGLALFIRRRPAYLAILFVLLLSIIGKRADAQSVVPLGGGSYASSVPLVCGTTDAFFGLTAVEVAAFYPYLHLDASLEGIAIPTNHWWTDLLIGDRSYFPVGGGSAHVLQQDPYGGNMWFYPGMLDPKSYGIDIFYPNSWKAANADGSPQGSIETGPVLEVHGDVPYTIPAGDILIADFENGYPADTINTGNGFAATPSAGSGLTGMMGTHCANTRDGGNGVKGVLRLPDFTVQKQYLHFLVCGGTSTDTQVRLVVSGTTVLAASGSNSTSLRWVTWDVSSLANQSAHVEIVDQSTASWGFISCDQIVHSDASNPVGRFGGDLIATNSVVTNWGDWNVDFSLPDELGHQLDVTMARGVPFTWTTWTGMNPKIKLGATTTFYDTNNQVITPSNGAFTAAAVAFSIQGHTYGLFLPDNTSCIVSGSGTATYLEPQLSGANNYMVVGYLPSTANLSEFAAVAYARPTKTQISWTLDKPAGLVRTTWNVTTTAMKGTNLNTIQGWLPHHYRTTTNNLSFSPYTYQTARGLMKCTTGNSFQIAFPFKGIAPVLPAPVSTGTTNDFQPSRMVGYLNSFNPGTMIGDTYWGGKSLALCAQNMAWAQQMGDTADFTRIRDALRTSFNNWLTYTPGESQGLFCYYPDWHALIGWSASYGSQAFNDLHFHYGYFATAAATLGMYDQQFLSNYGPMLKAIVKCYANWDRTDNSEPFLRTFDVWEGHSNAGGTAGGNGENQESSSEAMQSWGGLYLLGGMLNDDAMVAAGAMGFSMESCAVNEYWQDIYQTNFPSSYNRAGNGILTANAFAYGTYFSGDPAWVYGIQYCPSNHWLNYMTRYNRTTVAAKYQAMWDERTNWCTNRPVWSSTSAYTAGTWLQYNLHIYSANADVPAGGLSPDLDKVNWGLQADCTTGTIVDLGGGLAHVILVYQGLFDPEGAVSLFDNLYSSNDPIATNDTDAGSTYYNIHSARQLGDQDYSYTTSIPTSAVYYNSATGVRTYVVYNPQSTTQSVTVYNNGTAAGAIGVPAGVVVGTSNPNYVATKPPVPTGLSTVLGNGQVTLNWTPSSLATSYTVKRANTSGGTYSTLATQATASYMDSSGTVGNTYYYGVSASNSVGTSANSAEVNATFIVAPAAPAGLSSSLANGNVVLNWSPSTYATSYSVKRANTAGGTYAVLGTPTFTTFTDSTAATGRTYYYVVSAINAVGQSANSTEISVLNQLPPATPAGFSAALGNGQVALTWTAVTSATSYKIKRSTTSGGPYTTILSGTSVGGADTNVAVGSTYYYVTSALNAGGESANSAEAGVTVIPSPDYAVNSGGTASGQFAADANFAGGTAGTKTGTVNTTGLVYPAPQSVYLSNRFGNCTYTLGGFTPGSTYNVRLHFAETYWTAAGKRQFHVSINGTQVLTNFDIFAVSGTSFKATIQEIPAVASGSGQFVVQMTSVKDNAQINGIEVRRPVPVISSALSASGTVGSAFSYQISASNTPTSYGATGLPSGLSIDPATGIISGTPASSGVSNVTISAINSGGIGSATLAINVVAPAPVINSALSASGISGSAFGYQVTATNSPTSYGATGLPAGLAINAATGTISGSPSSTGTSNVTISATNAGGTGTATLVITVVPPAPVINSALSASGTTGSAFSYQVTATNSPTSYGATGLPAGLAINAATGTISGSPSSTGTSNVTISATNAGGTGMATLVITVVPPAPVINSTLSASGTTGSVFSYQITATNSPTSYGATGLPAGLTVDSATGVISGTPSSTGTSNVTISATNAGGTGTATLVVTVVPPTPVISSVLSVSGTVDVPFSYQIVASNSPTSYGATGLPAGLTINSATGVLSGIPSVTGTSNVTISASNAGGTGTASLTISIASYPDTNLAPSGTPSASTVQAGNLITYANDGSATTRWAASSATMPQWWMVDLGSLKRLSKLDASWYNSTTRAYKYKIEVSSDNVTFNTVIDKTGNTTLGDTSDSFTAQARYVRITVTGCSAAGGYASAFEFKVFGH